MFKKNNPGCNNSPSCRCSGGGGGGGPCTGCSSTQLKVVITSATNPIQILPVHFSPGPCNWLNMAGFNVVEGTYYIDWPDPSTGISYIELGRWASSSNPNIDSFSVGWCVYVRIGIAIQTVGGAGTGCRARLVIGFYSESDFTSPYTCTPVSSVVFVNDLTTTSTNFEFCTPSSGTASVPVFEGNADCAAKSFSFNWTTEPV